MSTDLPAIPNLLQARAKKLGLLITADAEHEEGLDLGSFLLRCGQTGYLVWPHGLPAEGIADLLATVEHEYRLMQEVPITWVWIDDIGWAPTTADEDEPKVSAACAEAWRDFGTRMEALLRQQQDRERR